MAAGEDLHDYCCDYHLGEDINMVRNVHLLDSNWDVNCFELIEFLLCHSLVFVLMSANHDLVTP